MKITQTIKFSMNIRNTTMKNIVSKVMLSSLLSCFALSSFVHAADENASQAEVKKQVQVCAKKKQGDWVVYANKGVTYNGSCEPNEKGKLQFSFPAPAGHNSTAVTTTPNESIANKSAIEAAPTADTAAPAASQEAPTSSEAPQASEQPATDAPASQMAQ